MKHFDGKSFVVGIILGTLGVSTAFAAGSIQSANASAATATLNGTPLSLSKPFISVTMNGEQNANLYAPAEELLETLGYSVHYDTNANTLNVVSQETATNPVSVGSVVLDLSNHPGQKNIAESGSFQIKDNQTLALSITSTIKGGCADLFLFDPDGNELRIAIGSSNISKEILLKPGKWQYNCSGMFTDGGDLRIVGKIK